MDFIKDFLSGGKYYACGTAFWNIVMMMVEGLMGTTPMDFSSEAWSFVVSNIYPLTLGVGELLLNIFYLVSVFRSCSNLKQNITLEMMVEILIKLVLANAVMQSGLSIIQAVFKISASWSTGIVSATTLNFAQEDIDLGSTLFYHIVGLGFFVVSIVCGVMILLVIYGRYLQLYLITVTMPLAIPASVGGSGISQSAVAWTRTFIGKSFEIFIIALVMALASKIAGHIDFGTLKGIGSIVDGAVQALQNIVVMVIVAASVKGADSFMHKAFSL